MASAKTPENSHSTVAGMKSKETDESQAGAKRRREALLSGNHQQVIAGAAICVCSWQMSMWQNSWALGSARAGVASLVGPATLSKCTAHTHELPAPPCVPAQQLSQQNLLRHHSQPCNFVQANSEDDLQCPHARRIGSASDTPHPCARESETRHGIPTLHGPFCPWAAAYSHTLSPRSALADHRAQTVILYFRSNSTRTQTDILGHQVAFPTTAVTTAHLSWLTHHNSLAVICAGVGTTTPLVSDRTPTSGHHAHHAHTLHNNQSLSALHSPNPHGIQIPAISLVCQKCTRPGQELVPGVRTMTHSRTCDACRPY